MHHKLLAVHISQAQFLGSYLLSFPRAFQICADNLRKASDFLKNFQKFQADHILGNPFAIPLLVIIMIIF